MKARSISHAVGWGWGLLAGAGAWLEATPVEPFTVRGLDLFWLALLGWTLVALARRRRLALGSPRHLPWWLGFAPFMTAMVLAPILGVAAHELPLASVSSSVRFAMFATVPAFFFLLRLDAGALWRGALAGLAVAVVANLGYATLQTLEFGGTWRLGTLPHHRLAAWLPGSRFLDVGRAPGLFLSGNHLGYFGALTFVAFGARMLLRPTFGALLLAAASLALPLLGNSRSALALAIGTLAVVTIVLLLVRRSLPRRLGPWSLAATALFVTGASVIAASEPLQRTLRVGRLLRALDVLTGSPEADTSFATRLATFWPRAWNAFQEYPFGYGAEPGALVGTIDSAWLTYLVQGSVPLVLLFAWFLVAAIWTGARAARPAAAIDTQSAGLTLVGCALIFGLGSIVLSPHHVPSAMMIMLAAWTASSPPSASHER